MEAKTNFEKSKRLCIDLMYLKKIIATVLDKAS